MRALVLAAALTAPLAAHAGEAEQLAEQLAEMINRSSGQVQCAPAPDAPTVICSARGSDADRLAAYIEHLMEAHTDGMLEGWDVILTPEQ